MEGITILSLALDAYIQVLCRSKYLNSTNHKMPRMHSFTCQISIVYSMFPEVDGSSRKNEHQYPNEHSKSLKYNNTRSLPSTPPPVLPSNSSFNNHSPAQPPGPRPVSVVSSRSYPGIESALEGTNNRNSHAEISTTPVIHTYSVWMGSVMVEFIIR